VEQEVRALAEQLGIQEHLECFRAQRVGDHEPQALVDRCWDLPAVNAHYLEFTERWRTELDRCKGGVSSGDVTPEKYFTLRFDLIHEFRAFPLEDPYLPRTLLPEQWHGGTATQLFHALHDVLEGPADQYVDEILAAAPSVPAAAER
jgi:phenylacetic acid degradation operon negative regulatory protein